MKMLNRYSKPNFRRRRGSSLARSVLSGPMFALAACCLALSSCTWEEFPDEPETLQKPVALSFVTAVDNGQTADTRVIRPDTDFGDSSFFPQGSYIFGMRLFSSSSETEVFEGSSDVNVMFKVLPTSEQQWGFYNSQGAPIYPRGMPGTSVRLTAYNPYDPHAARDSIPFDFSNKVNGDGGSQINLLLCSTHDVVIPPKPAETPIQLKFSNVYTKVVLRVTKRENKNDPANKGYVTETAVDNLTSDWIKNQGGIDPATGYVKPTSHAGKIWDDQKVTLTTDTPVEFTFLVPAFMDKEVKDDNFGFVLQIDGQQRLFPLKRSQLNTGVDANGNRLYGFESNKINTYNLNYNNSLLFLTLQSWNSVDANANFGESAEKNPTFELNMEGKFPTSLGVVDESMQKAEPSEIPELNYPDDATEPPFDAWQQGIGGTNKFKYTKLHINNTYLSSVLLGGNGSAVLPSQAGRLYSDYEKPYYHLQVTAIDVGGKAVIWQDDKGGLIAKDVCRNYRGNSKSDWRLPRVTEMKVIMQWAVNSRKQMGQFYGESGGKYHDVEKEDATPYWTATEADMGTPGKVDDQETAWYVQGYINSRNLWNYKVETRNKQDAAFIRCVREL
ncbi:fimbrillin family protein [Alistipes onderdonkii]|uniref:fimbrillin family protein n=1 Tax=Alistipes onderdonkii TaxID=328813 RepID=UPI001873C214|nr:fimbrillin family protein [Alistipes onderdonkii]MBE5047019.1 fimbrillin family protein [Alistipes onderdonkii]